MRSLLFSISLPLVGQVPFQAYLTFVFLGMFSALVFTVLMAKRSGIDPYRMYNLNLLLMVASFIGARLLHVVADGHFQDYVNLCFHPEKVPATQALVNHCFTARECGFNYLCDPLRNVCYPPQDCFAFAKFWNGGLAYYGGFLFSTAVSYLYCRWYRLPFLKVADIASPAIALGLGLARIGCFLHGCCFGKITSVPWGVVFPMKSIPWQAQLKEHLIGPHQMMLQVHPTQLYESVGAFAICLITYFLLLKKKEKPGYVLGALMVLYGILRAICELFRNDERGVLWGWLSTSQMISIPLVLIGLYLMLRKIPKTQEVTRA